MTPLELAVSSPQQSEDRMDVPAGREKELARRIGHTVSYMQQHLDAPLQVAALASQASVSLSHYFALFKRMTGRTPIRFFIDLRMERARRLLQTTSLSVKEIAAALGYDDPFYFSRVFKSVSGIAPTEYRAARQGLMLRRGIGSFGCGFADSGRGLKTVGECGGTQKQNELGMAAVPTSG